MSTEAVSSQIKENRIVSLDRLVSHPRNFRSHPEEQIQSLVLSLQRFGQGRSIVIQDSPEHLLIVAGHGIVEAAKRLNWTELRADILPAHWSPSQIDGYLVADNLLSQQASDDEATLAHLLQEQVDAGFDLAALGSDEETLRQMLENLGSEYLSGDTPDEDNGQDAQPTKHASLAERFIVPPFSVLDARQGYWQERKRAWIALGIQSELGRGEGVTPGDSLEVTEPGLNYYRNKNKSLARCYGQDLMRGEHVVGQNGKPHQGKAASLPPSPGGELLIDKYRREAGERGDGRRLTWVAGDRPEEELDEVSRKILAAQPQSGTSIFDPVLCELAYRWFSPPDGVVLDPFAGGSVRGIVAAKLGRQYIGIDLRAEQVEANEEQWHEISGASFHAAMVPVKVSAASARLLFHGCEPGYIRDVCHGRCCESSTSPTGTLITIHPRDAYKIQQRGGVIVDGLLQPHQGEKKCPFKTDSHLCGLHFTDDKPFGCIASPFTLHQSGDTLIVRNRYKSLVCFKDDRDGEPLPAYKAFRASLDLIFGKEEAGRICTHLDNGGGDITALMAKDIYDTLRENDAIKKGHATENESPDEKSAQPTPRWVVGDSRHLYDFCSGVQADLIFTCPPYYDLEMYSDNPDDLSTASTYSEFLEDYRDILKQAIAQLKQDRFVCVVVGDIRDKRGFYRNFVSDTITACQDAGAKLYNEAILVTSVGSLPIRVGKQFSSGRKLGKTHQNVLVFCKGDPIKAVKDCGPVVVEVPEDEEVVEMGEETIDV